MKVADGFEPGAVIGPLVDMKAVEKVEAHIADALKKQAKVAAAGQELNGVEQAVLYKLEQINSPSSLLSPVRDDPSITKLLLVAVEPLRTNNAFTPPKIVELSSVMPAPLMPRTGLLDASGA